MLALFVCAGACATEIRSLHLSPEADHTRATIELSAKLDYKLFEIRNPDRIGAQSLERRGAARHRWRDMLALIRRCAFQS